MTAERELAERIAEIDSLLLRRSSGDESAGYAAFAKIAHNWGAIRKAALRQPTGMPSEEVVEQCAKVAEQQASAEARELLEVGFGALLLPLAAYTLGRKSAAGDIRRTVLSLLPAQEGGPRR